MNTKQSSRISHIFSRRKGFLVWEARKLKMVAFMCTRLMLVIAAILVSLISLPSAKHIGVCYGLNGDNLPSPSEVISLYKRSGIELLRIYEPYPQVLQALRGSQITVAIGPRNEDLPGLATSQDTANQWVNTNIAPYKNGISFKWITIGNEIIPSPDAQFVAQAMKNVKNALSSIGLSGVKVTTVLGGNALSASYPPSAGAFQSDVLQIMADISAVLTQDDSPLMINVYPYFAYSSDPGHINPDYALGTSNKAVVVDGPYSYFTLFDAMVDAFNAALEKINFGNVVVAVAETGWPTAGNNPYTSSDNARTYNTNVLNHVMQQGTPRRPDIIIETFFFAMFNENLKPAGVEQNFGFFYPNMQPVYPFW